VKAEIYRYQFNKGVPMVEVEESLHLAILAAECLHGEAHVRLDAGYSISAEKRALVVDAGTQVGHDICRVFTGFAIKEFGEDAFQVERILRNRENAAAGKEDCLEG
jgi:hypothetical protein